MRPSAPQTTLLLRRMDEGDPQAAERLLGLLYGELHEVARGFMGGERAEHTLQPTALVHEAWLRLAGGEHPSFADRAHFVAVAARAMRRILIDHARKRGAQKRGGKGTREALDEALLAYEQRGEADLLALHEALEELEGLDPQLVRIVEQRFFAGATNAEVARALGVSERTVERGWKTARAWLHGRLSDGDGAGS